MKIPEGLVSAPPWRRARPNVGRRCTDLSLDAHDANMDTYTSCTYVTALANAGTAAAEEAQESGPLLQALSQNSSPRRMQARGLQPAHSSVHRDCSH